MDLTLLWIPATIIAAAAQTARNAMQRSLTARIGTVGATQVRFLYGLPFAILFLAIVSFASDQVPPKPSMTSIGFVCLGAVAQIVATGLMLMAMKDRSFATTTAYTKTEPVQVAVFAFAILGDPVSATAAVAIVVATAGVILMARAPASSSRKTTGTTTGAARSAFLGIAAGAFFAIAAVGFRGGILAIPEGSFVLRASVVLALGLGIQTLLLGAWMLIADRPALTRSLALWRPSLFAGFMGAFASQFWFIGFALTSAANVRTLALVEVFFAQLVARRLFAQATTGRERLGMVMIVLGVGALLAVG